MGVAGGAREERLQSASIDLEVPGSGCVVARELELDMNTVEKKSAFTIFLGVVLGAIAGLVIAPVLGMLITGDSSTMSGKEQGFVGFLYGVYWGPVIGAVLGALIGWRLRRRGPGQSVD